MNAPRGVTRKTCPVRSGSFDDRGWPVGLALMALVGLAIALVVLSSRFDEPRLLHNAWFRLVLVAQSFAVLLTVAVPFRARLTRRLQLALTVSLIGHLLLAAALGTHHTGLRVVDVADPADRQPPENPVVVPEYHVRPVDERLPTEAFERPHPVEAPAAQTEALTRAQTKAGGTEAMPRRTALPDLEPALVPSPIELRRPQLAAAHWAVEASQLSRQPLHGTALGSEPITAPRAYVSPRSQIPATLPAPQTPVSRRETTAATSSRSDVTGRPLVAQMMERLAAAQTPPIDSHAQPPRHLEHPWSPVAVGSIAEVVRPRRTPTEAPPTSAAADDVPAAVAGAPSRSEPAGAAGGPAPTAAATALGRVHDSLVVQAAAVAGPGGLETKVAPEAGLPHRKAQRESEIVHDFPGKYLQRKIGAPAAVSGRARDVAAAFTRRGQRQRELISSGAGRSLPETEMAIELGLAFLARHQWPDGRWSLRASAPGLTETEAERQAGSIQADTAATGLALLAYLGAGYDHYDDKYRDTVQRGLDFLTDHQQATGALFLAHDPESDRVGQMYSHGIATIALCEAVGMTGDPTLKEAAQAAIDFIARSQHPERGGWRYRPRQSSDLSVTSWHLMALKSGWLAGMEVPEETFTRATAFLDQCRGSGPRSPLYVYNPYAPDTSHQRHGRSPSTVMTSIGLLMRLYTESDRTDPEIRRGADHLLANLPRVAAPAPTGTLGNPMRDTYYWYHATQVMFYMRGHYWSAWSKALHPILVDTQIRTGPQAGSWDARRPVPDRWGYHGGRFYVTAMNLLSLEVAYRHLPIYESTLNRASKAAAPGTGRGDPPEARPEAAGRGSPR